MEILQTLRDHVKNDTDFPLVEIFTNLLDNIEKQLINDCGINSNDLHYDQYVKCCIDLEGFDGCGKSTVAKELEQQLNQRGQQSRLLISPPFELQSFRSYFDKQEESIRRAYYMLGNLIISLDLNNQSNTMITILDRYWPSTIAYHLAQKKDVNIDEIILSWSNYLVQPVLIIYITVDEEERRRRIAKRSTSIAVTLEEKELAEKAAFRQQLDSIYRNKIPSTRLHIIDGTPTTDIVVNNILQIFNEQIHNIQ